MHVHHIDHPLLAHKLTVLRKQDIIDDFPAGHRELVMLLAYEATGLSCRRRRNSDPGCHRAGTQLAKPRPLVVPILRAGLGMLDGMVRMAPTASWLLGMVRDDETLNIVTYADRLPKDLTGRHVFLLDPMLATGGTLAEACKFLYERNARQVSAICLLAAPEDWLTSRKTSAILT